MYKAEKCSELPKEIADHSIQFEEHKWIDTKGIGRYLNHSCEPNCGVKDKFRFVAIMHIAKQSVADSGKMYSNLMCSSCDNFNRD